ncbi:hypothetical protein HDV00_003877 [Rhizophlyctis rosea]|nr:hypothetical protein HDV00_003877 [Rhizophlyctis rosea]
MAVAQCSTKRALLSCSVLTICLLLLGLSFVDNTSASTSSQSTSRFRTTASKSDLHSLSTLSIKTSYSTTGPLLSPFLIPRVSGTENNRKVQQHIITTFESLNWHIEEDHFNDTTPYGVKPFNNIIVTKNPDAQRKLVLAAHFDSKYFPDFDFIGATDSAIPCAILVDIATTLNPLLEATETNDLTLQIIFFDGEEAFVDWTSTDSIYGSRHLAEKWENTLVASGINQDTGETSYTNLLSTIDVLVLLDLLGTPDTSIFNTQKSTTWMWDRLYDIQSRLLKAGLMTQNLQSVMASRNGHGYVISSQLNGGAVEDDHIPFLQRGVPILHAIAQPFPQVWHTEADNADAISPETVQDLALIFRVLVAEYLGLTP